MYVDVNKWEFDSLRVVNSTVKRCKIVGRSTSRAQNRFRVFQGFIEEPIEKVLVKFETFFEDLINEHNKSNHGVWHTIQYSDQFVIVDCGLYVKDQKKTLIQFKFTAGDNKNKMWYVNCQYGPIGMHKFKTSKAKQIKLDARTKKNKLYVSGFE